jgi:hypothetical protein
MQIMRPEPYIKTSIQNTAAPKFGKYADGKLPKYEDGKPVKPLIKSPQEVLKGVPHEQGMSGADPIGTAFVGYMGGRAFTGAMAAWNRLRALEQGRKMYKQAREWND